MEENEPIRESANEEGDKNFIWLVNKKNRYHSFLKRKIMQEMVLYLHIHIHYFRNFP